MTSEPANKSDAAPPEDAIRVGEDVYMVPVSVDDRGCQQYSAWSATRSTLAVIYYRRADGSFSMNSDEAACGDQ